MRPKAVAISIALTLSAVGLLFGALTRPAPLAERTHERVELNLGDLLQGTTVSKVVRLRNHDDMPSRISSAISSCACLELSFEQEIVPPEENFELTLRLIVPEGREARALPAWVNLDNGKVITLSVRFSPQSLPFVDQPALTALPDPATGRWHASTTIVLPAGNEEIEVSAVPLSPSVKVTLGGSVLTPRGTERTLQLLGNPTQSWTIQRGLPSEALLSGANVRFVGTEGTRELGVRVTLEQPFELDVSPRKLVVLRSTSTSLRLRASREDTAVVDEAVTDPAHCARLSIDSQGGTIAADISPDSPREFDIVLRRGSRTTRVPVAIQDSLE